MGAIRTLSILIGLGVLTQGCTKLSNVSYQEQRILESAVFSNSANLFQVGGVISSQDSIPATNPFHSSSISQALEVPLKDCTLPGLYEMEKLMAVNEAKADLTGATIPVKFAYSFGRKHDIMAKYANTRAALSEENGGVSYIPVGGKTKSHHNWKHFYYAADNSNAVNSYKTGQRCFFSTVHIPDTTGVSRPLAGLGDKYDFINVTATDLPHMSLPSSYSEQKKIDYVKHMIHYMFFGYCKLGRCAPDQAFAGEFANRLFDEVPSLDDNGDPQIIKLYMADFRSEQMQYDLIKLSEDTTRGLEIDSSITNIVNTCELHKNYYEVTKNLSLENITNGYRFSPIQGAVQLVHNILSHDVDGTMLSTQYTPIVLDLGSQGIKTSSLRWGTFFNMASLSSPIPGSSSLAHRTAWLGGDYVNHNVGGNVDPRVSQDVRLDASDGFLVLPDANGEVKDSKQMFGDNIEVNGQTYDNGFLALQALANKNCLDVEDASSKYVGPWDAAFDTLRVWVDKDRDGLSEPGELHTLRELNVLAINTCNIVHAEANDAFGNGTSLRAAMLMQEPGEDIYNDHFEIRRRLRTGRFGEGQPATFKLAVDLIFKVNEKWFCDKKI